MRYLVNASRILEQLYEIFVTVPFDASADEKKPSIEGVFLEEIGWCNVTSGNQPPFLERLPAFFLLRVDVPRSKLQR